MSSISGITAGYGGFQTDRSSLMTQIQESMQEISDAIQAGDFTKAKEALSEMESSAPPPPPPPMQGEGNTIASDLEALNEAFNSSDLQAIKDAFAQFESDISGVNAGNSAYKNGQMEANSAKMQQAMDELFQAIESGDVESAKTAFANLRKSMPPPPPPPPPQGDENTTDSATSSSEDSLSTLLEQLSESLESGDIESAKNAFSQAYSYLSQMLGLNGLDMAV